MVVRMSKDAGRRWLGPFTSWNWRERLFPFPNSASFGGSPGQWLVALHDPQSHNLTKMTLSSFLLAKGDIQVDNELDSLFKSAVRVL